MNAADFSPLAPTRSQLLQGVSGKVNTALGREWSVARSVFNHADAQPSLRLVGEPGNRLRARAVLQQGHHVKTIGGRIANDDQMLARGRCPEPPLERRKSFKAQTQLSDLR